MAISRFRRIPQPLDPAQYRYNEQDFIPDLSGLATITEGLQKAYDASEQIPIPKHLEVDANDVQERYVSPLQSLRQQAVENFTSGSLGDGMRALKRMQSHIYEMKQPGGLYHQYEQNYEAASSYTKQIDKLHEKGEITNERAQALRSLSHSRFPGTFDDKGDFQAFEGITAAKNIALGEKALEAAKGWAAEGRSSGRLRLDPATGTYLYSESNKFVDFNEVKNGVLGILNQNQEVMADLRQSAELRGLSGEEANEFINKQLDAAAHAAAMKEGFVDNKKQFYRNWSLEQGREHAFQKAMERGELTTAFFQSGLGGKKLNVDDAGTIKISDKEIKTPVEGDVFGIKLFGAVPGGMKTKYGTYAKVPIDQAWEESEEFRRENPGLERILGLFPRKRNVEENKLEPISEYNKRVAEAYNQYMEDKNNTYIGFNAYTNAKQRKNANDLMFGEGEEPGEFSARSYVLMSHNKGPQILNYKELMDEIDASDMKEVRERSSILGTTRPDNPVTPSGFMMSMTDGDGNIFNVIASPDDVKSESKTKPYYNLFQPKYNMEMGESSPQVLDIGGEGIVVKSKINTYIDENGNVQDQLQFFQAEYDEEGTFQKWVPSDVTEVEMQEAAVSTNPFNRINK